MGPDRQPMIQVQAMRVEALRCRAGVEVQLVAAEPAAFLNQPVEQRAGVALTAGVGERREVVDVEVVAPGEAVAGAKAGGGDGLLAIVDERRGDPEPLGALALIDAGDELLLLRVYGTQRGQRRVRQVRLAGRQLADGQGSRSVFADAVALQALARRDAQCEVADAAPAGGAPRLLAAGEAGRARLAAAQ